MNEPSIDPKIAALLVGVLRKELSDDPAGQDILARFLKAPKANSQALADYLRRRLDDDGIFKERLAGAQGLPPEMRAIVYGGQIERIVQIAEAGTVIINQGMPLSLGLTAVIISVIAVGALIITLLPKPTPPMGDGFNIAVAEFAMRDSNGHMGSSDISRQLSEGLFDTIQNGMEGFSPSLKIDSRGPKDVGVVADDDTAGITAEKLNARILIYGHVEPDTQGDYQVYLQFLVSDPTFSYGQEITGPNYLGKPVTGLRLANGGKIESNTKLNARVQALLNIVKGLSNFSINKYEMAALDFQEAIDLPDWEPNDGKEVAYLLLGSARLRTWDLIQNPEILPKAAYAFNQAYELDQDYARSYLGLGSVALAQAQIPNASKTGIGEVDKDKLTEAINWYSGGLNSAQPPKAYIPTRAALGLGQAYLLGYEFHIFNNSRELSQKYFQQVLDESLVDQVPDLAWFAANAHAGLGRLAGLDRDWVKMSEEYRRANDTLKKTPNPPKIWIARFWSNAAFAEVKQNHLDVAQDYYTTAIETGSAVVGEEELKSWRDALDWIKKEKP